MSPGTGRGETGGEGGRQAVRQTCEGNLMQLGTKLFLSEPLLGPGPDLQPQAENMKAGWLSGPQMEDKAAEITREVKAPLWMRLGPR